MHNSTPLCRNAGQMGRQTIVHTESSRYSWGTAAVSQLHRTLTHHSLVVGAARVLQHVQQVHHPHQPR
jgi:hypothetical protein